MRQFVTSKDGTKIAYETVGDGPTVLIVLGALNSRKSGLKLAKLLASTFTAVSYDRRGRGDSSDSASYAPEREVEDIAALIDAVGGPVSLYGHSSGAALAIAAAVKLRKQVTKLAIYEAPYSVDSAARKASAEYYVALKKALRLATTARLWPCSSDPWGCPTPRCRPCGRCRCGRGWRSWPRRCATTARSWARGTHCRPPSSRASGRRRLSCTAAPDRPRCATPAMAISQAIPKADLRTLARQTHGVSPKVLAPVLDGVLRMILGGADFRLVRLRPAFGL